MAKKVSALSFFVLLTLTVGTAAAQDVKAVLQAAAKNMGAENLKTIQITGKGWIAGVGQSYSPTDDWPRFEVTTYTRTIDYDAKSSREELTRRQGNYPARGQVIVGEQQLVTLNTGATAGPCRGPTRRRWHPTLRKSESSKSGSRRTASSRPPWRRTQTRRCFAHTSTATSTMARTSPSCPSRRLESTG